jgi:hypothetical protein
MIPVKDNPNWMKNGHAVVNTDVDAYNAYIKKRATAESNKAEIDNMRTTINNLNNKVDSMSAALDQILNLLKK